MARKGAVIGQRVRLSDMEGREIINLYDGSRMGQVSDADLLVDVASGKIMALVLYEGGGFIRLFRSRKEINIPWHCVKRIGPDLVIVDFDFESPAEWSIKRH